MSTATTPIASLRHVNLVDIELSSTNKIFRTPDDLTEGSLKELMDSIGQKGVISPVLLRAAGEKFILVAGERRYRACKALKLETIPSYIRDMTQEEAFELQLTENLQRKDVHPLKEAQAFIYLSTTNNGHKPYTTAELALRFGKGETYILQRMKLASLIPAAAADFAQNKLLLGHAILLARLTPADQEEVLEECRRGPKSSYHYESVNEMEEYIQEQIIRELKEAPFNVDDAKLVPKAGACSVCPKRSGASPLLFSDIKEKDRCFDGACFAEKCAQSLAMTVRELVEKKPDTVFLEARNGGAKVHPAIGSYLASQNIKTLKEGNDWSDYSYDNMKKFNGFMINGYKVGKIVTVFSSKEKAGKSTGKGNTAEKVDAKEAIARIKERTKRAAELDQEKVYKKVLELMETNKSIHEPKKIENYSRGLIAKILIDAGGYQLREELNKILKLGRTSDEQSTSLSKISDGTLLMLARKVALKNYSSEFNQDKAEGLLLKHVALSHGIPVNEVQGEQDDIRVKREERAKERIKALADELKISTPKAKKK